MRLIRSFLALFAALSLAAPALAGTDPIAQGLAVTAMNGSSPTKTVTAAPGTPAAGVAIGTVTLGGREVIAVQPVHGAQRVFQEHLGRGTWGELAAPVGGASGGSFLSSGALSYGSYSNSGNYGQVLATTNYGTLQASAGFASSSTAGNYAGFYQNSANENYFTVGNGSGLGGGTLIVGFMNRDAVAGALEFVGLTTSTSAPSATADPATFTNVIGLCQSQTAANPANLHICYGGSAAQTPIDLGASFPASTNTADFYELTIFSDPVTGQTGYTVFRYTSSNVPAATAQGVLTGTAGTNYPGFGTFLGARAWRSNNATAAVVALAVRSIYLAGGT